MIKFDIINKWIKVVLIFQALLQEAENIYNRLHMSGKSASLFYNTDDLFSSEVDAEAHLSISGKLEKLATNNMQMLG